MENQLGILQEIGMTKTESTAYITLLELGESLAGKIASKANLHRKNTYDALYSLLQKGLVVHVTKRGKKYWACVSPEKIKSILEERMIKVDLLLPELFLKFKSQKKDQSIEVFEGKDGMKSFYDFVLKVGADYQIIGASGELFEKLEHYIPNYVRSGLKKNIHAQLLCRSNTGDIKEIQKIKNVKTKILPESFVSPTQIMLFDGYSAIIIWSDEPISILISSKKIYKGFKEYFDFLWKISKLYNPQ